MTVLRRTVLQQLRTARGLPNDAQAAQGCTNCGLSCGLDNSALGYTDLEVGLAEEFDLEPSLQKLLYCRCRSQSQRCVPVAPCSIGISVAPIQVSQHRSP